MKTVSGETMQLYALLETADGCTQLVDMPGGGRVQREIATALFMPISYSEPQKLTPTPKRIYEVAGRIDANTWHYREVFRGE